MQTIQRWIAFVNFVDRVANVLGYCANVSLKFFFFFEVATNEMYRKYTCTFGRKWTEIDWLKSRWLHVWNQLSICIETIWLPLQLFGRLEVDHVLPMNSLNVLYYVSKTTHKTLAKRPETLANWSLVKPSVTSKVHSYISLCRRKLYLAEKKG